MPTVKQLKYWQRLKGKPTWNTGTKGIMRSNKTSFKKGQHPNPQTEIKKGQRLSPKTEFKRKKS